MESVGSGPGFWRGMPRDGTGGYTHGRACREGACKMHAADGRGQNARPNEPYSWAFGRSWNSLVVYENV